MTEATGTRRQNRSNITEKLTTETQDAAPTPTFVTETSGTHNQLVPPYKFWSWSITHPAIDQCVTAFWSVVVVAGESL